MVLVDYWLSKKGGIVGVSLKRVLQLYLVVLGPAMAVLGGLIAARAGAVEESKAVRAEATIAKTRLLQSQLHPHVLFNALNGLAELIHKDPPTAERSVMHLADLLRGILRASEVDVFTLGEERALLENYLVIEGLRLGPRLRLRWDWDRNLDPIQALPLLLQPLVENAIKHGIAPHRQGGELLVRARRSGTTLSLEVWNTGAPYLPKLATGIGLKNLRTRLELRYGSAGHLAVGADGGGTLATIQLTNMSLQ